MKRASITAAVLILALLQFASAQKIGLFVGDADLYICEKALEQQEFGELEISTFSKANMDQRELT